MIINITNSYMSDHFVLGSDDKRFIDTWGHYYRVHKESLYKAMIDLHVWAGIVLRENCQFEFLNLKLDLDANMEGEKHES